MVNDTRLLLKLCVVFCVISLLCVSCRKADLPTKESIRQLPSIEQNFFNSHKSLEPKVNAIAEYVKRLNDKKNIVELTVQRIGYPRWDKAFKLSQASSSIAIKSTSTGTSNGATTPAQNYDIYSIPFVRDSQNYVNASMIVKVSPSDTSISYICDWQYRNKQHGSPNVSTTAENHALFFMTMSSSVFGHKEFDVTDPNLFPGKTKEPGKKRIGIVDKKPGSGLSVKPQDLVLLNETCYNFHICETPGWCANHGGCDNCGTYCYPIILCWQLWGEVGGSGNGGTGWGLPGNGSGDNGSGGGTGGNTPPGSELPPVPCEGPPSQASVPGSTIQIKLQNEPCSTNPGWTPTGYDDLPNMEEQAYSDELGRTITFGEIFYAFESNPGMVDAIEQGLEFNEHGYNLLPGFVSFEILAESIALGVLHPGWNKAQCMAMATWNVLRRKVHFSLDVLGLAPVIGEPADIVNGVIYFLEGDRINAVISIGSAVPIYGWVFTGGKWVKEAVRIKPLSDAVGKLAFRAIKNSKGAVRLIKIAVGTLDHAAIKALKAVPPADRTLTNLSRELVDQQSHRIAPLPGSVKTRVDDIVSNGDASGSKTEALSHEIFETNGFVKHEAQFSGNHGFDGVYIKKDASGNIEEIIINEAKPIEIGGNIKLRAADNNTGLPAQMSDAWIDHRIAAMQLQGGTLSTLANILNANRSKIIKTVTGVDKATKEIVILKLANY